MSLQLSCYPYSLCIVEHLALIWPFLLEAHQAHPAAAQWFVADPAALKSAGKADGSSDAPGPCRVRERAPQPIRSIVASGSIVQPRWWIFRKWMNLTFIHECSLWGLLTSLSVTTTRLAFQNRGKILNTKGTSYWERGNQVDLTPENKIEYLGYFFLYCWYQLFIIIIFLSKTEPSIFFSFKLLLFLVMKAEWVALSFLLGLFWGNKPVKKWWWPDLD